MSTSVQPRPADQSRPIAPRAAGDSRSDSPPLRFEAWKNAAGYVAAAAAALVVLAATLRLWHARLNVPLYAGDNLMAQMFVQNILESGWVLDDARLGAPAPSTCAITQSRTCCTSQSSRSWGWRRGTLPSS